MTTLALGDLQAINPLDVTELIKTFGWVGLFVIIFAETGLLVGFFFPGDSLLFMAGVAASPFANQIIPGVQLPIVLLLIGTPICAIVGAQLGHLLGARYGVKLFNKPNSRLFRREYVDKAEQYFVKFGPPKAIVLARFIPIVRTFLNPVAGVLGTPTRTFLLWNVIGGLLWTDGILLAGYFLAKQITDLIPAEDIDKYLLPFVMLIILISVLPILLEILRTRRENKRNRLADGPVVAGPGPIGVGPVPSPSTPSGVVPRSAAEGDAAGPRTEPTTGRTTNPRPGTNPPINSGRHRSDI